MTTQDNLKNHIERGIDIKDLPKTFQDAIQVVRGLKLRYLWIDALCIIQNEDHHEDWKRECGKMASIYRNSHLTIAAAWADSANGGCFTTPDPGVIFGPVMMRKVSHFYYLSNSSDFPILARAWIFQERFLAPRVIYFSRQEILWECTELRTCECGGVTNPVPGIEKLDLNNQGYTGGIGLWKETLLGDMCWNSTYRRAKRPPQMRWRAPSWSWASVDGPIEYYMDLSSESWIRSEKNHALVREAQCTPSGPSLTGEVEDGFITLDACLIPASFGDSGISANCSELEPLQLTWIPDWEYDMEEMPVIYLIPIMNIWNGAFSHFYGLVVKPHDQGTEMTRVGLASHIEPDDPSGFGFLDCQEQVVKIV
ncbi:HET domain-containing protein [Fusarium sp. LHS14.1]|nr:HET domain-containing protein [Fusarium sp. LHS14.1]